MRHHKSSLWNSPERLWFLALLLAACVGTNGETLEPVATTAIKDPTTNSRAAEEATTTATETTTVASSQPNTAMCPSSHQNAQGPSVTAETILQTDELTVRAAVYPHPDYEGNPWSQWGRGVLTKDGRFLSAIGDHRGRDGNSYFYEFNPESSRLTQVGDVLSVIEHREGDWGYGKIHGALVRDDCIVYAATYWGTRRDLEYRGTYQGDHLLRWDPSNHRIESLGFPVEHQGIPSLAGFDKRNLLYGEALQPDDQAHTFFVYDVAAGRVVFTSTDMEHVGFRDVMVGQNGAAYFSAGDGKLMVHRPGGDGVEPHPHELPGDWLRASAPPTADGTLFGVTRDPDHLFELAPSGEFRDLGPTNGYVASLALDVERGRIYYMRHAHGGAWEEGAPVIAVDTATGDKQTLVELETAAEEHLELRLGGSYNTVYDASARRLYLGMNAGRLHEEGESFGEVVLLVIEWP